MFEGFNFTNIVSDELNFLVIGIPIIYAFIGFILFTIIEHFKLTGRKRSLCFSTIAGLGIISIHILVACMGGTPLSVLSFSYIYLPTVVGLTFSDKTLYWTAGICLFSGVVNVFWPTVVPEMVLNLTIPDIEGAGVHTKAELIKLAVGEAKTIDPSTAYKFLFTFILGLQITVTAILAPIATLHKESKS